MYADDTQIYIILKNSEQSDTSLDIKRVSWIS